MRTLPLLAVLALLLGACSGSPTEFLQEPIPMNTGGDDAPPVRIAEGTFSGASGHTVTGTAALFQNEDGSHFVRLENLSSDNGPDLEVWLVRRTSGNVGDGGLSMGELLSTQGNQNYFPPNGTDYSVYLGVSIWCRRFGVNFGTARFRTLPAGSS
ncbi:MAG: hypothetical protein Rubg2KO_10900 [Rubricoccaceae bacterium]